MKKILFLEDDEFLSTGISFTLEDEGFEVVQKTSIKECKEAFDKSTFDLVLLDITLPDGNGYDICKYIRTKSNVPIIFLTACDEEANLVMGLEIGGDDYITKPFGVKTLLSRIKAVLRRTDKSTNRVEKLISGDIEMDIFSAKVTKNREDIQLTPQEFRLLSVFLNNPNMVLSREVLLDRLSEGEGGFMIANTLSVYIKRLREKIENDYTDAQYIITSRGMGYKWNKNVIRE